MFGCDDIVVAQTTTGHPSSWATARTARAISTALTSQTAASRPPTEPRTLQGDTDWAAFLSRSDPINTFNISEPMTVPAVNGRVFAA